MDRVLKKVYSVLTIYEEKEKLKDATKQKVKMYNLRKHTRRLEELMKNSAEILEPELGGKYVEALINVKILKKKVNKSYRHKEVKSLVLDTTNIIAEGIRRLKETERKG